MTDYTEQTFNEAMAVLELAEKRILCACRLDHDDETVVDVFTIRKELERLKSEIATSKGDDNE